RSIFRRGCSSPSHSSHQSTALWRTGKFSARVQELLQESSPDGPGGKPEMMYELAMALDDPSDVPEQLRMVFRELRRLGA
ncbi:hypothetical protein, partial [Streptomyces decoyicus]|uniref:hypothetical protein n=1 Tax=Streptomyces decoyicus TaxID=249567 RepID=UPI0033B70AE4